MSAELPELFWYTTSHCVDEGLYESSRATLVLTSVIPPPPRTFVPAGQLARADPDRKFGTVTRLEITVW